MVGLDLDYLTLLVIPHSFRASINLDKKLAGLYLSLNNFDVTSELIVGDYNPNFFDPDEQKINI